eukprot:TRINITY_DN7174_c0_g2_i2.p1 TRINITY_DN7174_c0_g2~~TRINITY_DN7174_c0_g2_i2.p1  ORF type:complete len:390 (-),score=81.92 TRINITY_DN7174_c0_g2_i2:104-1273(-)
MQEEYGWSSEEEGYILSSFFAGYILTQVPGGWLASKFGGKWVLGISVVGTAVLTLVTPISAKSIYSLMTVRILEGVGEGMSFPAMHALMAKWAPPAERSRMGTLVYGGAYLGTIVAFPVSGLLASSDFLGGWPSVFYVFGVVGCIWFIVWAMLAASTPSEDRFISAIERDYIVSSLPPPERLIVPWKKILTNIPMWAIIANHTATNFGFYTLLTWLPTYLSKILHFDVKNAGFIAVLPYLTLWILYCAGGIIADILIEKRVLDLTTVRKLFQCTALILSAACITIVGFITSVPLAVFVMTMAVGTIGFSGAGYGVNHLDIGPRYAGILMGITNTAATIPGIVTPSLAGIILKDQSDIQEWREVFYLSAGIMVLGAIVWAIFASGKKQFV